MIDWSGIGPISRTSLHIGQVQQGTLRERRLEGNCIRCRGATEGVRQRKRGGCDSGDGGDDDDYDGDEIDDNHEEEVGDEFNEEGGGGDDDDVENEEEQKR